MHVGPMVRRWMGGCNRCMDGDFVIEVERAGFASGRSFRFMTLTRYTAELRGMVSPVGLVNSV